MIFTPQAERREVELTEEKMKLILEAMQGMTYLEWRKLRHVIDRRFDADASAVTRKMPLADVDTIVKDYHIEF